MRKRLGERREPGATHFGEVARGRRDVSLFIACEYFQGAGALRQHDQSDVH